LHRSGRVEYEVDPESDYLTGRQDFGLLMKETRIEPTQVEAIIRLGQTADFQDASPVYPKYQIWEDSWLESKVTFKYQGQEKTILINNFGLHDPLNKVHYPASLLAMLRNIWELRPPDYAPTIRDVLINQPDYAATESFTSSFMGHGFSTTYKTYKRGDCYRRQSETQITYSCLNQPNTIYYPKTQEYREEARPGNAADTIFISDVQTFARMQKDAEYKLVGTETIGDQDCRKIEAKITYKDTAGGSQEFTYVFYVAKNLNDLVIGVDITGKDSYASSRLNNIRLDFPDKQFAKPLGYRLKR
jgi:hypothetical protein